MSSSKQWEPKKITNNMDGWGPARMSFPHVSCVTLGTTPHFSTAKWGL